MKYRAYGKTGKKVSEIGFGAWQLGNSRDWSPMSSKDGEKLVHKAIDLGINFFDTAPNYGLGKSEEILGNALFNKRENVVINTKFGHQVTGEINFDASKLKTSIDDSLKRLKTEYLDSVLLHNPSQDILLGHTSHFEILEEMKEAGKILDYGASVDSSKEILQIINNSNSGIIETIYNIFHQETKQTFKQIQKQGLGLIIKVPLDSGWLSGKYNELSTFSDIRKRWSQDVLSRRNDFLKEIIVRVGSEDLAHKALRFILKSNEVSTVIPGMKNLKQLEYNTKAQELIMDDTIHQSLVALYEQMIKSNPLPW